MMGSVQKAYTEWIDRMEPLNTIQEITENPYYYAKKWKEDHAAPVIGYFCSYTPEEIIHAAGFLPFRIFGTSRTLSEANTHLQSYCCSLVRGALDDALKGELSFLDGTVFPHTCDSIQRLSDIWRLNARIYHHFDIVLPVKLNTASAQEYFLQTYRSFKNEIEKAFNISISDERLQESITLYNEIRSLFMHLYELRSNNPEMLRGSDFHTLIRGAMIADRRKFKDCIKRLILELEEKGEVIPHVKKKRILLSGGVCTLPDFYTSIEEAGGSVVWDDFCTGTRLFEGAIPDTDDPIGAIAKRYIERINCPAKHASLDERGKGIVAMVKKHNVDGVIFLFLKFCEPHSFDYPYIKDMLDSKGIPSLRIELDDSQATGGQLETRIETFIQMI